MSPLVIGNAAKAGVRFLAFDQCKEFYINYLNLPSSSGLVLAGLSAGVLEAILVVSLSQYIDIELGHSARND